MFKVKIYLMFNNIYTRQEIKAELRVSKKKKKKLKKQPKKHTVISSQIKAAMGHKFLSPDGGQIV